MAFTLMISSVGGNAVERPKDSTQAASFLSIITWGQGTGTAIVKTDVKTIEDFEGLTETFQKTNTRTTQQNDYLTGVSGNPAEDTFKLRLYTIEWNCSRWIAQPRRPIVQHFQRNVLNSHDIDIGYTNGSPGSCATGAFFQEINERSTGRRFQRRSKQDGSWQMFGNVIVHHAKTSSGAFAMKAPSFMNDIMFQSPWPWKLGFGSITGQDILLGAGTPPAATRNLRMLMGMGT